MFFRTLLAVTMFAGAAFAAEPDASFAPNVVPTDRTTIVPDKALLYADGREGTLNDYEGTALLVTLWQEHCPYCHVEMPKLDRLAGDMAGENVKVIAIGLDQDMGLISGYLADEGYTNLEPIMDIEKINGTIFSMENFNRISIATPTSFVIDPQGRVAATVWGLVDWDSTAARDYLRAIAATPDDRTFAALPVYTTTPQTLQ